MGSQQTPEIMKHVNGAAAATASLRQKAKARGLPTGSSIFDLFTCLVLCKAVNSLVGFEDGGHHPQSVHVGVCLVTGEDAPIPQQHLKSSLQTGAGLYQSQSMVGGF